MMCGRACPESHQQWSPHQEHRTSLQPVTDWQSLLMICRADPRLSPSGPAVAAVRDESDQNHQG